MSHILHTPQASIVMLANHTGQPHQHGPGRPWLASGQSILQINPRKPSPAEPTENWINQLFDQCPDDLEQIFGVLKPEIDDQILLPGIDGAYYAYLSRTGICPPDDPPQD